jgi:hypothetical protein
VERNGAAEGLGGDGLPASLEAAIEAAVSELPSVATRAAGRRREYLVASRVVATLDGNVAEYALDAAVAAAALRTPDTRRSASASDRIAFEPQTLDRYAVDRALAWFRHAVRRAG